MLVVRFNKREKRGAEVDKVEQSERARDDTINNNNVATNRESDRRDNVVSKSAVYTDVNDKKPKEYWDYENLQVSWESKMTTRSSKSRQREVLGGV